MKVAEVEQWVDVVVEQLPDALADLVGDITIHVARDRNDLEVLKAAVKESGQGSVKIPQDFRAVFLGEPLDPALDDEAEEVDPIEGVILLNASMLRNPDDVLYTLLHELGHAVGYDEDEISALGLE